MNIIIILVGLFSTFLGVKSLFGIGGDEITYADITLNFTDYIREASLSKYYAQRILPSAIIWMIFHLARLQPVESSLIIAYSLYNLTLLLCGNYIWKRISDNFNLTTSARWVGFFSLFLNYQSSTQTYWAPILTDTTALLLGLLLLYAYLDSNRLLLTLTGVLGSFAWQTCGITALILLVFTNIIPRNQATFNAKLIQRASYTYRYQKCIYRGFMLLTTSCIILLIFFKIANPLLLAYLPRFVGIQAFVTGVPSLALIIISLLLLVGNKLYLTSAIKCLLTEKSSKLTCSLLILFVPATIMTLISNPLIAGNGFLTIFKAIITPPGNKLFLPFITALVFWGPMVLLLSMSWEQVCFQSRKLGWGFSAVIAFSLPLILVTEPRFITLSWPFFVLVGVLVYDINLHSKALFVVYSALTLGLSQFWFINNPITWLGLSSSSIIALQAQFLRDHYGLWISWSGFYVQGFISSICGILFYLSLRFTKSSRSYQ